MSPTGQKPVVVSHQTNPPTKDFIFYNSEQLTRPSQLAGVLEYVNKFNIPVWDYSAQNVKILLQSGIEAKHVPIRIGAEYEQKLQKWLTQPKLYDFGFCGSLTPYRQQQLDLLRAAKINVHLVHSTGDTRDQNLAQCKRMLNLHAGPEYRIFEAVRCEAWLHMNVPVISEPSLDDDPRCILVNNLVSTLTKLRAPNERGF